jgi:hypothetical protein
MPVKNCDYCLDPDRYGLEPAIQEREESFLGLDKVIRFVSWHYEKASYLAGIPRKRIRCQKSH